MDSGRIVVELTRRPVSIMLFRVLQDVPGPVHGDGGRDVKVYLGASFWAQPPFRVGVIKIGRKGCQFS